MEGVELEMLVHFRKRFALLASPKMGLRSHLVKSCS